MKNLKQWFQETIKQNIETFDATEEFYLKTMSKKFTCIADDDIGDFHQWSTRMNQFKLLAKYFKVKFEQVIVENNTVATIYWIMGERKDGSPIKVKVIAFFKIKNKKLFCCNYLSLGKFENLHFTSPVL